MFSSHHRSDDERLDALFRKYSEACQAPEASAQFMPHLWQKIEARQKVSFLFGRWARSFVTAAVALSLAMALVLAIPRSASLPYYSENYVEILAADHVYDTFDYFEPVHDDAGMESAMGDEL